MDTIRAKRERNTMRNLEKNDIKEVGRWQKWIKPGSPRTGLHGGNMSVPMTYRKL